MRGKNILRGKWARVMKRSSKTKGENIFKKRKSRTWGRDCAFVIKAGNTDTLKTTKKGRRIQSRTKQTFFLVFIQEVNRKK